jgi:hypothetical protein
LRINNVKNLPTNGGFPTKGNRVTVAEKPQALERGLSAFAAAVAFSGPTPCCCYRKNMLAGSHAFFGRG